MVRLIAATQEALSLGGKGQEVPTTPKWVTPMLLFIDLYEKVKRLYLPLYEFYAVRTYMYYLKNLV
jgi:hypothetical protein